MRSSRAFRNIARGWTELPETPANVGLIFSSNMTTTRPFYLTGWKFTLMLGSMCLGLYTGQKFGGHVLTRRNPANPPRVKDADKSPKRHPHSVDEDE